MYSVLGHEEIRDQLSYETGSFILQGPPGVGRRGIIAEWAADKSVEFVPNFGVNDAREIVRRSAIVRDLVFAINAEASPQLVWSPLLKPLEEGHLKIAAISPGNVPEPILSRVKKYRVGFLSEVQVIRILARDFPKINPRPLVAKVCAGSLDDLDKISSTVQIFEPLNKALADRVVPYTVKTSPEATFRCLKYACLSVLCGTVTLPFSKPALGNVSRSLAQSFLASPEPVGKNEARNYLSLFFGALYA